MRKATVTYYFGGDPCVPMIRLRGRWLKMAGFDKGTPFRIDVTQGRLTLTAVEASQESSGD
jgi:Toxin SymE, type I toxin-antitoxin system